MTAFVISCSVVILCCCSSLALEDEPVFSKLKYDKEMLETMVRMEARMAQWDKERKSFEETVTAILAHRREETQQLFAAQNEKLEELAETLSDTPKIAFNAYTTSGGSFIDNEKIILPLVLLNEGNGYNNKTGIFTAPVSGLYQFNAHICETGANYMVVAIVHNNKEIAITTEYQSVADSCSSVSAPAIMNANDHVFIKSAYGASKLHADTVYRWPSFTGFLVQK